MVVQTLVENAIKHGISKLKRGGLITLRSCLQDSRLFISIENNGSYQPAAQPDGVGMKNAGHRLRLVFGQAVGAKKQDGVALVYDRSETR